MTFFEYEVTPICGLLKKRFGKFYNNSFGNGLFWAFVSWLIFHFVYENFTNKILKKLALPSYIRLRLMNSLWYLCFFMTTLFYCKYSFSNSFGSSNNKSLNDNKINEENKHNLDYAYITGFYLHTFIWEVIQNSLFSFNYLFFSFFLIQSHLFKMKERTITVMVILSIVRMAIEISKLSIIMNSKYVSRSNTKSIQRQLRRIIFIATLILMLFTYVIIFPFLIIMPLIDSLMNSGSFDKMLVFSSLFFWLPMEIYYSPFTRLINHMKRHRKKYPPVDCVGSLMECTFFKQREDIVFNLKMFEIAKKERQANMLAKRKPKKGSSMLFQTFKCMVAINRKIKMKKQKKQKIDNENRKENEPEANTNIELIEKETE